MTRPTQVDTQLSGSLEGIALPALIRDLSRRRLTGTLQVESEGVRRTLFLDRGQVSFAASSNPNDRLGEHLLRMGKVTVGQLEAALSKSDTGKRLGMLMVDAGIFSSQALNEAVIGQIRSVALDLLKWTEGTYRFEEGPIPEEDVTLNISTDELVFAAIQQIGSLTTIERGVGTPRTMFRLCDEWATRVETLGLSESAQALIERLSEGPTSVATLCREVSISNFKIQQTLWAFKLLGVVEPCGRRRDDEREGNLRETSVAELLIQHENSGETGVLYVSRGSQERSILFAAGRCVFATSNDPDDGLINFLFCRGVISLQDKEETVRRLLSNKRVGTILREIGAIDAADLQSMVRQQVSEIIYDTLGWQEGEFLFCPSSLPSAEEITLSGSVRPMIAEGVRRVQSWTRLVQGCGGVDNPLCLTPDYLEILDDIDAGVAEWEVINALKSPQTPRRVCNLCDLDDFRVCQILWTLKILGALEDSPIDIDQPEADDAAPAEAVALPDEPHSAVIESAEEPIDLDIQPLEDEPVASVEAPEPSPAPADSDDAAVDAAADDEAEETTEETADDTPETQPVEYDLPPEFDQAILRFNEMHRIVYRTVRTEVGAGAGNFIRSCCVEVAREAVDPLEGVRLLADGSWDVEGLKRVIVEKGIDDPWPAYERVLEQEFISLEPLLGEGRAAALKQEILSIEQGSGQRS